MCYLKLQIKDTYILLFKTREAKRERKREDNNINKQETVILDINPIMSIISLNLKLSFLIGIFEVSNYAIKINRQVWEIPIKTTMIQLHTY